MSHDFVDLGLPSGTLWATCNVGANSPVENGNYFAWGEFDTKLRYNWDNYTMCWSFLSKYNNNDNYGKVDNLTELELLDDVANVNWGEGWQIPSDTQWEELFANCTWEWIKMKEVIGYKVIGNNGNTLFLPATGHFRDDKLVGVRSSGSYWSRSLFSVPSDAWFLLFDSDDIKMTYCMRYLGLCIRPVRRI